MNNQQKNTKPDEIISTENSEFSGNPAKMDAKNRSKEIKKIFGASTLLVVIAIIVISVVQISNRVLDGRMIDDSINAQSASELKIDQAIESVNSEFSEIDIDLSYQDFEDSDISADSDDESLESTIDDIDSILELSEDLETDLGDFDENALE